MTCLPAGARQRGVPAGRAPGSRRRHSWRDCPAS